LPLECRWIAAGLPLECRWNAAGLPLDCRWIAAAMPLGHASATYPESRLFSASQKGACARIR
jgi:hypothetical protein